jgi:hypothetical protein
MEHASLLVQLSLIEHLLFFLNSTLTVPTQDEFHKYLLSAYNVISINKYLSVLEPCRIRDMALII